MVDRKDVEPAKPAGTFREWGDKTGQGSLKNLLPYKWMAAKIKQEKAAEAEARRQLEQVAKGQEVTKSGEED